MMPRKKRIATIVIMISFIIVIICSILAYLIIATDVFKSDKELFCKYLFKTSQNLEGFLSEYTEDFLNEYTSQMEVKVNYITDINTTDENQQNDVNNLTLNIDSIIDKNNSYDYKQIYLQNSQEKLGAIEYIKDNNIYGIRVAGVKQFVSVKNNNLKELSKNIGLSEEQIKLIPNEINNLKFDVTKLKFTEEEKNQIANTYLEIINNNVSKASFSKQKNALITIEDKEINTEAYSLTLNKEQYNSLKIKILEQLQKDEVILAKIDLLQTEINNIYKENAIDYKQNYIEFINDTIKEIKDTNIGQEEVKITVYVNSKKTIRILIDDKTTKNTFDFIEEDNKNMSIEVNITKYDTVENSIVAILKKENEDNQRKLNISFTRIKDEETQKFEFIANETRNENNISKKIGIIYNNGANQILLNIDNDIEVVDSLEDKMELNNNNNIILNELDKDKVSIIVQKVENKLLEQINTIQSKINSDDLTAVLSIFNSGESISIGEGEITENQKNRFNSQFEFYQGDEVQVSDIKSLLSILKNNTLKAEIVSDNKDDIKIRILVKNQNNDDEGIADIEQLLDSKDNKDKKYKIRMGYDEDGIINAIAITYTKK